MLTGISVLDSNRPTLYFYRGILPHLFHSVAGVGWGQTPDWANSIPQLLATAFPSDFVTVGGDPRALNLTN
jgi:hypothetical protein